RTEFDLKKAEARHHILEGLRIAIDHLDEVIKLVRGAKTVPEAREGLMTTFGLTQIQSQAILDMQLQRLTGLERQKILDELAELLKTIERLRAILASERLLMQIIVDELKEVKTKYGDDRRTEILEGESGEIIAAMLAVKEFEEDKFVVMGTRKGVIKKTQLSAFSNPRAGGIIAMGVEEGDSVITVLVSDGKGEIFIGTRHGMAIRFPEDDVRPMGRAAYGVGGLSLRDEDVVVAMEMVQQTGTLLTVTDSGY